MGDKAREGLAVSVARVYEGPVSVKKGTQLSKKQLGSRRRAMKPESDESYYLSQGYDEVSRRGKKLRAPRNRRIRLMKGAAAARTWLHKQSERGKLRVEHGKEIAAGLSLDAGEAYVGGLGITRGKKDRIITSKPCIKRGGKQRRGIRRPTKVFAPGTERLPEKAGSHFLRYTTAGKA